MSALITAILALATQAAPAGTLRPEDTEVWKPEPAAVTPGRAPGEAPSDAVVLFDGKDLSQWQSARGDPAGWTVVDGEMRVALAEAWRHERWRRRG